MLKDNIHNTEHFHTDPPGPRRILMIVITQITEIVIFDLNGFTAVGRCLIDYIFIVDVDDYLISHEQNVVVYHVADEEQSYALILVPDIQSLAIILIRFAV